MCAREMGAGRGIAILASLVTLMSPLLLGANWLFQTVTFDQLTWLIAIFLLLRILRTGDARLFILLGVDIGVGLETKLTILALCVGIVAAVLVSRDLRPFLRTRYPWIGVVIALALFAPNVAWQIANAFPSLTYVRNHSADIANSGGMRSRLSPISSSTPDRSSSRSGLRGSLLLLRDQRLRPIGVLTVVAILAASARGQGVLPRADDSARCSLRDAWPSDRIVSTTRRRRVTGLVVGGGFVQLVVLLPVDPSGRPHVIAAHVQPRQAAPGLRRHRWAGRDAGFAGRGRVQRPAGSAAGDDAAILTNNYGEAGRDRHLWRSRAPPSGDQPSAHLLVLEAGEPRRHDTCDGRIQPRRHRVLLRDCHPRRYGRMPDSVANQEAGTPILICTHLRESINAAWPSLRGFN